MNFYKIEPNKSISIKTYEKGVEKLMLSCASGSTAVVYHLSQKKLIKSPVTTFSPGGSLKFNFNKNWQSAWVTGPAEIIFSGRINPLLLWG